MNYMLLITETAEGFADRHNENAPSYWSGWMTYSAAIAEAGIFVSGAGLAGPETATVLRFDTKGQRVQDGPFIDSKEQVGGFFIIDVPHLDAALEWARKAPITRGGSVEVRPCLPPPPRD
ncbi:YciI family protein [Asticcacaulis excentricus]|uniref:YCII-related protein n=1 Tax=Asticcacaulis excentricus (strain ATCC 15261 / DSM 4724 / KCTC 12464 / NCIMB 9791 / VKM B-1370 / CB 48) TaxID=573065 RepID=E8RVB1_ASTEC|nr:YciI family protein [Asticcacaulis excentricus]ADU15252.1 YCII-related protein [Asticcacaulis excentricus CB 48]